MIEIIGLERGNHPTVHTLNPLFETVKSVKKKKEKEKVKVKQILRFYFVLIID